MAGLMLCAMGLGAQSNGPQVQVDWKKVDAVSRTTPTLQVFATTRGRWLLLLNKRDRAQQVTLPADAQHGRVTMVAPSTGDDPPKGVDATGATLRLEPFEVAVVAY
jgi:hypothetical protein